jgi:hypothetical protein
MSQNAPSSSGSTGGPTFDVERVIEVDGPVKPDHDEVYLETASC